MSLREVTATKQSSQIKNTANGNMLSGAGRTLNWNSWNMPINITGTTQGKSTPNGISSSTFSFIYNANHERLKETLPDGTIVYNISPRIDTGIHVEKRIKPDGSVEYQNALYAGSYPLGSVTTNASGQILRTRYYHTDPLGSIIAISNESGQLTERRSYDAWGKRRNLNGTATSNAFITPEVRHGYTGHEELDDVALIHMNGRLYDPAIGRFLSADPIIQYPDDMQNYNRYSYINNNPLLTADPSGHGFFLFNIARGVVRAVGGLIGTAVNAVKAVLSNSVVRTVVAAYIGYQMGFGFDGYGLFGSGGPLGSVSLTATATTVGALNGAAAGFAMGFIASGGSIQFGLSGALTGGMFGYLSNGTHFQNPFDNISKFGNYLAEGNFSDATKMSLRFALNQQMIRVEAKIARALNVSPAMLDVGLMSLSMAGNAFAGSRFRTADPDFDKTNGIGYRGYGNRGLVGYGFDTVDAILLFQGKPTGSVRDFAYSEYAGSLVTGHSLGTLDASYSVATGLSSGGYLVSVPFLNTAPSNANVTLGRLDPVNAGSIGKFFNPSASMCSFGVGHEFNKYKAAGCY